MGYRTPVLFTLVAATVSLLWAAGFAWRLSSEPGTDPLRLTATTTAGFTQFGMWLFSLAVAYLVSADHLDDFAALRLARNDLAGWLAAKTVIGVAVGLVLGLVVWGGAIGLVAGFARQTEPSRVGELLTYLLPMGGRILFGCLLSALIGVAIAVVTGYRQRLVILLVFLWPIVIERILSAVAPGDLGAHVAPYRSFAYYVSGYAVGLPYPYPASLGWLHLTLFTVVLVGLAALAHRVTRPDRSAARRPR